MILSKEAQILIKSMLKDISSCSRIYKELVNGCYDMFIENYKLTEPKEGKEFIVDYVYNKFIKIINKN